MALQQETDDSRTHDAKTANKIDETELLVIGAGLFRTGTKSLQTALQILYQKPCHHMLELLGSEKNDRVTRWAKLCKQKPLQPHEEVSVSVKEELRQLMQGFEATVDMPACLFYKELMELYPKAKVILTTRPSSDWLASSRATVIQHNLYRRWKPWSEQFLYWLNGVSGALDLIEAMNLYFIGSVAAYEDDTAMLRCYDDWNAEVRRHVPADRLLVFEAREGWAPLCQFLGKPVPNQPYPFVNNRKEMQQWLSKERRVYWTIYFLTPILVTGIVGGLLYFLHS